MSAPNAPPCLFLSHSGADIDVARELKRRLLNSSDARAAGLRVWLDKDDLVAGVGRQAQREKVICMKGSIKHDGAGPPRCSQCPLWVKRRHGRRAYQFPVYTRKQ